MSRVGLSTPQLSINGDSYTVVPNSIVYDVGEGEINVRSGSIGGDQSETIHTIDAENQISMVKFSLFITPDVDSNIRTWKNNVGSNAIELTQRVGTQDVVKRFPGMSCTTSPERAASADGVVEVEFKGDPAVI